MAPLAWATLLLCVLLPRGLVKRRWLLHNVIACTDTTNELQGTRGDTEAEATLLPHCILLPGLL